MALRSEGQCYYHAITIQEITKSLCFLTYYVEPKSETHLRFCVHLALIDA